MALQRLEEESGMSYAKAVEVALKMKKVQFAKTLVGKQVEAAKLLSRVGSSRRTLLGALCEECGPEDSADLQPDLAEMLSSSGVGPGDADAGASSPLHHACAKHNDVMVEWLLKNKVEAKTGNEAGMTPMACLFWNFQVKYYLLHVDFGHILAYTATTLASFRA